MSQSSIRIKYRKTKKLDDVSRHGLLATIYQFAQSKGMFQLWDAVPLKMKSVIYSPADRLKTLWVSIVVGCEHTYDINSELGAHEKALAKVFAMERFPDRALARKRLDAMMAFANDGRMIPEQVWDRKENDGSSFRFGSGTGSATPLAWSMAQFIRLAVNIKMGRNTETPQVVFDRYISKSRKEK